MGDFAASKREALDTILPQLRELAAACCLCGHRCGVDRLAGETGVCCAPSLSDRYLRYSSYTLHFGEEPPLVGTGGSGTVFFTHCNLSCVFCQNHQISQGGLGRDASYPELALIFRALEDDGAENINLVTPTHYMYPIALALREAYAQGLTLPVVYNTNGYDSPELLALLDGIVDIYLPDMKYMDGRHAGSYSNAPDYPEVAQTALLEMFRQVGPLQMAAERATRGLIIRHLILPNNLSNTYDFLLWMKEAGLAAATLSLMRQYSPQHRANDYPELVGHISDKEYQDLVNYAIDLGIENLLVQGFASKEVFLPDFKKDKPFEQNGA